MKVVTRFLEGYALKTIMIIVTRSGSLMSGDSAKRSFQLLRPLTVTSSHTSFM